MVFICVDTRPGLILTTNYRSFHCKWSDTRLAACFSRKKCKQRRVFISKKVCRMEKINFTLGNDGWEKRYKICNIKYVISYNKNNYIKKIRQNLSSNCSSAPYHQSGCSYYYIIATNSKKLTTFWPSPFHFQWKVGKPKY